MNLFDRIRKDPKNLADKSVARKRPQTGAEVGVSGDFNLLYNREEARKDTISVTDYRKMLDNDGTAEAVYNLLTLPVKGATYHFEVDEGGAKELALVEDNFTLPPHMGGMSLPFDLFIADMLRGIVEGFRLFETVVTIGEHGSTKGKYVYRKLAPRDNETVTLRRDLNGGFAGAQQKSWNGTIFTNVTIPVERCFLFTYAKERDYLYGRSAFKSAFYHYDRKHKLYYLQHLGGEFAALPGKKLTVPESVMASETQREQARSAVENFGGFDSSIVLGPDWALDEYKSDPMDLQSGIDHHDTLIARSVLAQFIVLAGNSAGSYSLGESDKESFLQALQGIMKQIEQHINYFLIPNLIDWNFGTGIYPRFKFEDISSNTKKVMSEAFNEIIKRPDMPSYMIEGIVAQVAEELGIEVGTAASSADQQDPETNPTEKKRETERQNSEHSGRVELAETYDRELSEAEKRVNLADIAKRIEQAENRLTSDVDTFFTTTKDDTIKRLTKLLEKGDIASLKKFDLTGFNKYRKMLEDAMMAQYLLGKRTAADEVGANIPQTPAKSRQYITTQAQAIADKQQADLTFLVKAEVTKELRAAKLSETRELGIPDIMARIAGVFAAFTTSSVSTGIAVSLAGAINIGRGDSFGASSDIDRMQYSAILDGRTTAVCKSLDSAVVSYEAYLASPWKPPVHFNCRSIWVAILKDDGFKPEFRPIPAAPGGMSAPQLEDVVEQTDLSDTIDKIHYIFDEFKSLEDSIEGAKVDQTKLRELERKLEELGA